MKVNKMLWYSWFFWVICGCQAGKEDTKHEVIISNEEPRKTINGEFVDAHDGRVIQFGDTFYWYGTAYGSTTGFTRSNYYQVYSSTDMKNWSLEGPILPDAPSGIYYRPHVIYHEESKQYVLWFNWYPKLWEGRFGVAISDKPTGPFKIVNDNVAVSNSSLGVGDFNLYVDEDKVAYLMYNTINGHKLSIEKLNSTYTASAMDNSGFIAEHCEAGSIFKRNDIYYLLTDYTCCFCTQGSGARVYTADGPMGPFTYVGNINRYPGTEEVRLIDGKFAPNQYAIVKRAENGGFPDILVDLNGKQTVSEVAVKVFTGNRKGMCGDTTANHVHELIQVPKMTINGKKAKQVDSTATHFELTYSIDKEVGELILSTDTLYNRDELYIAEIILFDVDFKELNVLANGGSSYILDQPDLYTKPIVPAQQTYVMELKHKNGKHFIWMGDMWGSAPDNIKGHDIQYWSPPLEFDSEGQIKRMEYVPNWQLEL